MLTVLARTPEMGGARAHSLLCVPRDTPGVEIGAEEHKMGLRGSSTVTVSFDGVQLPMDNVLGTPGQGMAHAQHVLTWGRTIMASGCVGAARNALNATLEYVTTRKQFGRAIGKFGASRAHVATMAAKLWAMEAMVEKTGAVDATGESIEAISAATKVFCSNEAFDVCDRAIQLHGALGFLSDLGIERLLRDCRVTRIFEGANDVILVFAGTALIATPDATDYRRSHGQSEPALVEAARKWDEVDGEMERAVADIRDRYGVKAVRYQLLLQRLARAHIALQAASVSIWRAAGADESAQALANRAVGIYLTEARDNLHALGRAENDTADDMALSNALYAAGRMPEGGPTSGR
jgi:alkylation response protein AidB-like acyl-CoA dehydrogenase